MTDIQFANLESTHNEIIGKCKFNETDFISPSHLDDNPAVESNRRHSDKTPETTTAVIQCLIDYPKETLTQS